MNVVRANRSNWTRPLLPAPPREVFRRRGVPVPVRCVLFLFIPHVWVGTGVLIIMAWMAGLILFGHDTTATVVSRNLRPSKGGMHCEVTYDYEESGRHYTDEDSFSADAYQRLVPGTRFGVRSLHIFGLGSSQRMDNSPIPGFFGLLLFASVWNGIIFTLFFSWCLSPLRERRLLRDGEVIPGKITDKRIHRGKSTTYTLAYCGAIAHGALCVGQMSVSKADHDSAELGDEVLILYEPGRRRRSVLYKYSQYAIRDMHGYEISA